MQKKPDSPSLLFSTIENKTVSHDIHGNPICNSRGEPVQGVEITVNVWKRKFANGVVERYDAKTGTWSEETK